jgi:hypothetical protein
LLAAPLFSLPPRPGNRTCAAHHGAGHQMVTTLLALSTVEPATAGRRPPPCVVRPYPTHGCHQSIPCSISPPLTTTLPHFHLCLLSSSVSIRHLRLPVSATSALPQSHPSLGKNSPFSPLLPAPGWSSSCRPPTPGKRVHCAVTFLHEHHRHQPLSIVPRSSQ